MAANNRHVRSGSCHSGGMSRPATRSELLARIDSDFESLLVECDRVPPDLRCAEGACGQWSVKDLLAHLDAWHELVLAWERAGRAGEPVAIPAPGLTWARSQRSTTRSGSGHATMRGTT